VSPRPAGGYSGRPAHGLRLEVIRDDDASTRERVTYRGHVHVKEASIALELVATAAGVEVALDARAGLPPEDREVLEKQVAALVRAATRAELAEDAPLPQRISRWRAFTRGR
jgi:hypothetical protein